MLIVPHHSPNPSITRCGAKNETKEKKVFGFCFMFIGATTVGAQDQHQLLVLRSWQVLGDPKWCLGLNLGLLCSRQASCPLYYGSDPKQLFFF